MPEPFDPYLRWLGIRDPERPPDHYRLLGVEPFEADPDVLIHAADRQMAHVRSFQSGKHSAESQKLLNELAAAKVCLLSPAKRAEYDGRLRAALAKRRGRVRPAANPPPPPAAPVRPPVPPPVLAPIPSAVPPPVPPAVPPPIEEPPPLPEAASWPRQGAMAPSPGAPAAASSGGAPSPVPHRAGAAAYRARPLSRPTALLISTAVALLGAVAVAVVGFAVLSAMGRGDWRDTWNRAWSDRPGAEAQPGK